MATRLSSVVKDQLTSRSTQTSLTDLQGQGVDRVRVIRSSQILELIGEAVDKALRDRGLHESEETREGLLDESREIFRGMLREEMETVKAGEEAERNTEYRGRLEKAEEEVARLRDLLLERDQVLQESRAKEAELDAELRVRNQRQESGGPEGLLDELRALRSDLARGGASGGGGGPPVIGSVDDAQADLSGLFAVEKGLESNMDSVAADERKGGDVTDALARMKSLKGDSK